MPALFSQVIEPSMVGLGYKWDDFGRFGANLGYKWVHLYISTALSVYKSTYSYVSIPTKKGPQPPATPSKFPIYTLYWKHPELQLSTKRWGTIRQRISFMQTLFTAEVNLSQRPNLFVGREIPTPCFLVVFRPRRPG